ncbi:pleiotropic drug resistance protein 1-like [Trifolium medium]|uniref:Pleiotropic drug resistance protein 1-like n=1 Tax=Trifolium medium TaxID=97028 RepID=A0A392PS50_9FABA|nr:pleiotropic drug resistance protein 1-like [Trifolium medium]
MEVSMLMFNGLAELSMIIAKLPGFYKQRDLLFFPSWAYAIPTWILKIPITFVEAAVWVILTYYVIGFDPNVESLDHVADLAYSVTYGGIAIMQITKAVSSAITDKPNGFWTISSYCSTW